MILKNKHFWLIFAVIVLAIPSYSAKPVVEAQQCVPIASKPQNGSSCVLSSASICAASSTPQDLLCAPGQYFSGIQMIGGASCSAASGNNLRIRLYCCN